MNRLPVLVVAMLLPGPDSGARAQGDAFQRVCAAAADRATADGHGVLPGRDGWLYFGQELRHLAASARPEAVPAMLDFRRQLADAGVELLVVPVPTKAVVHPEGLPATMLAGAPKDAALAATLAALRTAGVEVIDLGAAYARYDRPARPPLFCRTDTHWSGTGLQLAARAIASWIERRPWYAALPRQTPVAPALQSEARTIDITGDLARSLGRIGLAPEAVELRMVGRREAGRLTAVAPDRASPIVLLGDSHNLVFHAGADLHATGAGLPDHLALATGITVDLVAVRGSGATPARVNLARRARADAGYLPGKKLVVWVFSARELSASPWQTVPLRAPSVAPKSPATP